jgi:hypothetical protein
MPSYWKRGTLAAFIALSLAGLDAGAQQPQARPSASHCTELKVPCEPWRTPPGLGQPCPWLPDHQAPPPHVIPGEAIPKDPSEVPPPPGTEPMPPRDPMTMDPMTPQDTPPVDVPPETAPDLAFSAPEAGIGSPDIAFSGSPNMMGDLLRAYRGITFSYLQAGDFAIANTSGAVNFRNSKVAENNNAIPRDRLTFRYNYFKEALQVDGLQFSPFLGPPISQTATSPIRQFHQVQPASKSYNVHLYTVGFEKTFLDNMASVEVRVPFARTIDSNLNLVSGDLIFDVPDVVPLVQPTPRGTLGDADTELQDMNLILKAIIAQDPGQRWVVSAGLGVTIPTGEDLNARVVDFSNDIQGDFGDAFSNRPPNQFAFDQRTRWFEIQNQTWGIAPFLAAAMTPTNRTFVNAFAQVDIPLNSSDWTFRETDIDLELLHDPTVFLPNSPLPRELQHIQFDRTLSGTIDDQYLLQLDVGAGYWFYRNPCKKCVKGVAGLLELHYTGTLNDADIVTIPEIPLRTGLQNDPIGPTPPPRLGNIANRVDILNVTIGSHILVGPHASISTAYVAPLRDELDRTFDGELNVQLNLYR